MPSEMMFNDVNALFVYIESLFSSQRKPILIYAFNGTGKTRLANLFYDINLRDDESSPVCLNYGALFEDAFQWDNTVNELHFTVQDEWLRRLFEDEGLENRIKEIYGRYHFSHFEPFFDVENQLVYFQMATGDDESNDHIKISTRMLTKSMYYLNNTFRFTGRNVNPCLNIIPLVIRTETEFM